MFMFKRNIKKEPLETERVLMVLASVNIGGGVQNKIMDIYRNIDRNRVQYDFFVHTNKKNDSYEEEINSLGGNVYYLGRVKEIGIFNYLKGFYKLLKNNKYKVVHSYLGLNDAVILSLAKLAKVKKRISHVRTNINKVKKKKYIKALLKFVIKINSTYLLAASKLAGESLYGKSKFDVIPNALDIQKFMDVDKENIENFKKKMILSDNMIILGHVGRFSYEKNHDYLIKIANELIKKTIDFKIILVGDGELKEEFESKINKANLEQYFYITGAQLDVEKYYHVMDVLLFPSIHEGFGNVAIEAQVAKKHVIASNGVSREVDLDLGLVDFISLDRIDLWIKEIIYLKKNIVIAPTDKQLKNVLSKKLFDIEKSIDKYYTIYDV